MAEYRAAFLALLLLVLSQASPFVSQKLHTINSVKRTKPFVEYDDAPNTADNDDAAVFHHPYTNRTLILTTAKRAGLGVYSASGALLQFIAPPNRPIVTAADPYTPAGLNDVDSPCPGSSSGETYGRFNGIAVVSETDRVFVVTDRGCDRLRFYQVSATSHEVVDVTHGLVPRVFRTRLQSPSPFQAGEQQGLFSNPVDDQNTAYGVAVWAGKPGGRGSPFVFVSQRSRSVLKQLRVVRRDDGTYTYRDVRVFVFNTVYELPVARSGGTYTWAACREEPDEEDPQSEGIVLTDEGVLYAGIETVGIYRADLRPLTYDDSVVHVGPADLVTRVTDFGRSYTAIPDDDEFACEYGTDGPMGDGSVFVNGTDTNRGQHIVADVEGIALMDNRYLFVSSQGDSSFHVYDTVADKTAAQHVQYVGGFKVFGVSDTDGLELTTRPVDNGFGKLGAFKNGLLVVHNGDAKVADDAAEEINGYELDGATQFVYVRLSDVRKALGI